MKKIITTIVALSLAFASAQAVTVSFTAQAGTGVANLAGTALSGTSVQLGHYDGSTFSVLGSGLTGAPLAGMFGDSALFESTSLAAVQPALRIFSDDGGSVIVYNTTWAFLGGDGSGTDTGTQSFDLTNVIAAGGAVDANGVILATAGSTFQIGPATNPTFGTPALQIGAVPEPSAFAALAGVMALGFVALRRRRA